MALSPVRCPYCQSEHVIKGGKTDTGKQRSRCHNSDCSHQSFLLDSAYEGRSSEVKQPGDRPESQRQRGARHGRSVF